jgi:two-component system cell cycle sensor histidine kinase/response regulator CckA
MRHETELLEEQRLCEHVLDESTDALAIVDRSGHLLYANRVAKDEGNVAARLVSRGLAPGGDLAELAATLLATGRADEERRLRDAQGKWHHVIVSGSRVASDRFAIVVRDVTERRELEAELGQLRRVESLGYLTASVVHDFNNMLTPIVCLSALLTHELERGSRAGEMAGEIRETAERAAALVRQILSFVRRAPEPARRLNVGSVVSELRSLLERVVGDDVELAVAIDDDAGDVSADREQLEQVLLNLATNARDAMPAGGRLFVSTTPVTLVGQDEGEPAPAGAYVAIRVSDTGVGMPPEVQERAFERFFTTKPQGEGNGLGLAAAHRFARASGGCISVRSAEGAGTTVTLCLPRLDGVASPPPPSSHARLPRGSETILVVEDDKAVRGVVRALLEAQGYRVLDAASGSEALDVVAAEPASIHLVITDIVMPGMSGRVLADTLAQRGFATKILFMSGHAEAAIRDRGVSATSANLLRKAFSPAELLLKVRDVLGAEQPA